MSKSWTEKRDDYLAIAREVNDVVTLTTKDGWFWRAVASALFVVSFGQFSRERFLNEFASTLGPIQAYPASWTGLSKMLVVHEARHTRQFLFAGWFVPIIGWLGKRVRVWVGLLPMALVYGLFPLPIFFAWGRFRLELDADSYSWRVALRRGWKSPDQVRSQANWFAKQISSWAYLRTWPTSWTIQAFERRAEEVIREWEQDTKSDS